MNLMNLKKIVGALFEKIETKPKTTWSKGVQPIGWFEPNSYMYSL